MKDQLQHEKEVIADDNVDNGIPVQTAESNILFTPIKRIEHQYNEHLILAPEIAITSKHISPPKKEFRSCRIIFFTIITSLGSFFEGFEYVVFNPLQESICKALSWTEETKTRYISIISVMIPVGMVIGSFITGPLSACLGRKWCFILNDAVGLVGIGLCVIPNTAVIIIGRFICGLIVGGFLVLVPLTVFEEVPREYNNMCAAIYGLSLAIGVTVALSLSNVGQSREQMEEFWWQVMFAFPGLILLINMIFYLFIFTHDTPKYLYLTKNRRDQARIALRCVYANEKDIEEELNTLQNLKESIGRKDVSYKEILCSKKYRKLLIIGITLALSSDLTGMSIIDNYSTMIYLRTTDLKTSLLFVSFLGYTELITKFLSIFLFCKIGKRVPFLLGIALLFSDLVACSFMFYSGNGYYVRYLFIFIIINFGLLISPVISSTLPELLPDKGVGFLVCLSSSSCIISVQMFPFLIESSLKIEWTLMMYAGFTFLLFVVFGVIYRETTGMTSKQILDAYEAEK